MTAASVVVRTVAPRTTPATRTPVTVRRRVQPRPVADLARLTRYRGGTYSHTVDTITFVDGSTARTDLIRLNPLGEAYSLDFTGHAPTRPSHYRVATWSAVPNLAAHAFEAEVDWILRNSFPRLGTAELSRRLRAAGYPLGVANIGEHEAIAGTQAAIWRLTNNLDLDNRPLNIPDTVTRTADAITVEFDGPRELGSYAIDLVTTGAASTTLHRSVDGIEWQPVAASTLNVDAGAGTYRKALGVGATVSAGGYGRPSQGYRFYRVTLTGPGELTDIRFWLNGSSNYRNPARIVHLYDYLLEGARRARARTTGPRLTAADAAVSADVVGPFRLMATDRTALQATNGTLIDADGALLTGPVHPGTAFFVRPDAGATTTTVTMRVPGNPDGYGGRVLTGVARDEASARFTPLALAVPADLVVDFDIDWSN